MTFLKSKIVYLDEQAVFDFLELQQNGHQTEIMKKVSENMTQVEGEVGTSINLFTKFRFGLSGNGLYKKSGIIESQVASTLLSSFSKVIKDNNNIICLEKVKLTIEKDSPAYYRNITPVLDMINDIEQIPTMTASDINNFKGFEIKKIESTLDKLSGYYEIKGSKKDGEKMILRFNISGLRNNYTLSDLTKIDMKIYGIKIGETDILDLKFDTFMDNISLDNKSQIGKEFEDDSQSIPIYDVLVAGV